MPYDGPPFGVTSPPGYVFSNLAKCASCDAGIAWHHTTRGHRAPLNPDGTSHFATCPNAADHRRQPKEPTFKLAKPTPPPDPGPLTECRHSNLAIAAMTLSRHGAISGFDAVYDLRCPIDGAVRRNTRLAATIHTLRHVHGWLIDTRDVPGRLAEYHVGKWAVGTMPRGARP